MNKGGANNTTFELFCMKWNCKGINEIKNTLKNKMIQTMGRTAELKMLNYHVQEQLCELSYSGGECDVYAI